MAKISILYVIGGLGRGGTERQLYLLLKHLDRQIFAPSVVSLSTGGAWVAPIRELGVPVIEIPRRRSFELGRFLKLYRVIRRANPDILQTFSLFDNVYGFLAGRLARIPVLVASRRTNQYSEFPRIIQGLNRFLWGWAGAIICNAEQSRQGAPPTLMERHIVIRNGIERPVLGRSNVEVRRSLNIPADVLVIGNVGRLVPAKNYQLFIEIAAEVFRARQDVVFLWVGGGPLEGDFQARIQKLGLEGKIVLTGERDDVADFLGAMDLFLLTSDREGLSNALMEAMSMGVACVGTDVGGNSELVLDGTTGYLCPLGNTPLLVQRLQQLLDDPELRECFGINGRKRMTTEFSTKGMVEATQALYHTLLTA